MALHVWILCVLIDVLGCVCIETQQLVCTPCFTCSCDMHARMQLLVAEHALLSWTAGTHNNEHAGAAAEPSWGGVWADRGLLPRHQHAHGSISAAIGHQKGSCCALPGIVHMVWGRQAMPHSVCVHRTLGKLSPTDNNIYTYILLYVLYTSIIYMSIIYM